MNDQMDGYYRPVCRPLTRRLMMVGVPAETFLGLLGLCMQCVAFKLYVCVPVVLLLFFVLRQVYAHDQWVIAAWRIHIRMVMQQRTELEV